MKKYKACLILGLSMLLISQAYSQSFNKEEKTGNKSLLLGKINREALSKPPYKDWFTNNYNAYTPNVKITDSLKNTFNSFTITLFMGTWCGDSKREVPKFYKVLDSINFPIDRLTAVAVHNQRNQYKQSPGGEDEGLNIHRVPTFIFYKNGKEVNRIVESPKKSIEEDLLAILTHNYTSKYESVTLINQLIKEKGSDHLLKKSKKVISKLKPTVESLYELNTYGNVLFFKGRQKEALAVLELNTLLFPEEANTYISLANKYLHMNLSKKALKFYEKSLKLSKNKEIKNKIDKLRASIKEG